MTMATKLGGMVIFHEVFPSIKSYDPLSGGLVKSRGKLNVISLLPQELWPLNCKVVTSW